LKSKLSIYTDETLTYQPFNPNTRKREQSELTQPKLATKDNEYGVEIAINRWTNMKILV
jgi:hypothetical protein